MKTPDGQKYGANLFEETGFFLRSLLPLLKAGVFSRMNTPSTILKNMDYALRYGFSTSRQLESAASRAPQEICMIDDEGIVTYEEALWYVKALSRSIQRTYGIGKKSKVGILARNGRGMVYALSIKGYLGFDVYLLNAGASSVQTRAIIEEHELDMILLDEEFVPYLEDGVGHCQPVITWAADHSDVQRPTDQWPTIFELIASAPNEVEEKLPHFPHVGNIITMSSGTTGTPKGVVRGELRSPKIAGGVVDILPWRNGLIVQLTAAMFHTWGWANLNLAMATLSPMILRRIYNGEQAYDDLKHYDVGCIVSAPGRLKDLLTVIREHDPDPSFHSENIEFIVSAGNALPTDVVQGFQKYFGPIISNFYGSTETTIVSLATGEEMEKYPNTAGRPLIGAKIKILDENGHEVPNGTVGRIFSVSSASMNGFTDPNNKMEIEDRLIEIGDKGYINDEGLLFVLGRNDDMIIVNGENLYPKSVEECLAQMPGVDDVYVDGVDDEQTIQRVRTYVSRTKDEAGENLTEDQIRDFVESHYAGFAVPRDVYILDSIPKSEVGKVEWRKLPGQIVNK